MKIEVGDKLYFGEGKPEEMKVKEHMLITFEEYYAIKKILKTEVNFDAIILLK